MTEEIEVIDETIAENLALEKSRKIGGFSAHSMDINRELASWNLYRAANIATGVYDEATTASYILAYKTRTAELRSEFYRLKTLIEDCSNTAEVEAIEWTML